MMPQSAPWGGYNMGPNFDQNRPYNNAWGSVPVPGISSGMLASGMNFDYLPPQTPIMVPQPPPSPLQQYVSLGGNSRGGPFAVGSPVRIVHMTSAESAPYNGLVGDIVAVNGIDNMDGTTDMIFDIRCPLENRSNWFPDMCRDKDHGTVKPSHIAMQSAPLNVKVLGPDTELYRENSGGPPPYLIIKKLNTEKLEPIGEGTEGHGFRRPGPPGVEMLPTMSMAGVMGPPTQSLPPNSRPLGPMDMSMNMSMRGGPPGMPPTQPWGMTMNGMPPPGSFGGGMMPGSFGGGMPPPGSFGGGMGGMPGSFGGGNYTPPGSFVNNPFMSGMR